MNSPGSSKTAVGPTLAAGSHQYQHRVTGRGRAGRVSQAWRHFDDSSFSQGQTLVGGPQAAVLAPPPHPCSPSHSRAWCFCPSTQTFSLGHSEEVVKKAGRAALQDPGRSEVRRHWGIPTNLPGSRECLPTQCEQGSSRTLHCSLPASEAQIATQKATAMAGPRHPASVRAAALVQTERLQV